VVAGLAAALTAALVWVGHMLTRPAHSITGPPPSGLEARTLVFSSAGGGRLSAWYVPGAPGAGAVLLLHALRSDKRSMLSRAQFLKREGYAVLLLDLPAHGESNGDRTTAGYRESEGVRAAVAKLRELAPGEKLGVLGVSLGAAALVLAEPQIPVDAMVLESMYPTIEEAIADRLRIRFGAAGQYLAPLLLVQLEPGLGIKPSRLRPIDRLRDLRAPLLIVHGTEDRHTTLYEAERLYAAAGGPKDYHAVAGAAHVDLHAFSPAAYEARIGAFLARYLRARN
jgi:alpha-beta hydrolase superfamily lysophospholipase